MKVTIIPQVESTPLCKCLVCKPLETYEAKEVIIKDKEVIIKL